MNRRLLLLIFFFPSFAAATTGNALLDLTIWNPSAVADLPYYLYFFEKWSTKMPEKYDLLLAVCSNNRIYYALKPNSKNFYFPLDPRTRAPELIVDKKGGLVKYRLAVYGSTMHLCTTRGSSLRTVVNAAQSIKDAAIFIKNKALALRLEIQRSSEPARSWWPSYLLDPTFSSESTITESVSSINFDTIFTNTMRAVQLADSGKPFSALEQLDAAYGKLGEMKWISFSVLEDKAEIYGISEQTGADAMRSYTALPGARFGLIAISKYLEIKSKVSGDTITFDLYETVLREPITLRSFGQGAWETFGPNLAGKAVKIAATSARLNNARQALSNIGNVMNAKLLGNLRRAGLFFSSIFSRNKLLRTTASICVRGSIDCSTPLSSGTSFFSAARAAVVRKVMGVGDRLPSGPQRNPFSSLEQAIENAGSTPAGSAVPSVVADTANALSRAGVVRGTGMQLISQTLEQAAAQGGFKLTFFPLP